MTVTDNKVVLITGAARGIGLATAKVFLRDGWDV
ncbi:MAG: SDR family NAD(P)-dependent oxidoreductase, partial [Rhizobiaceae bacterium]|nr:SDR family NAD(P)-dependent oxidoreductase [Rhizobiaceae bacterium]